MAAERPSLPCSPKCNPYIKHQQPLFSPSPPRLSLACCSATPSLYPSPKSAPWPRRLAGRVPILLYGRKERAPPPDRWFGHGRFVAARFDEVAAHLSRSLLLSGVDRAWHLAGYRPASPLSFLTPAIRDASCILP